MVVGEADRRDGQLRHQSAADVVVTRQDQVEDVAADVGWCGDVLSQSVLQEHISSTMVQLLTGDRPWYVEVPHDDKPAVKQRQLVDDVVRSLQNLESNTELIGRPVSETLPSEISTMLNFMTSLLPS